jgi:hypothetical protein
MCKETTIKQKIVEDLQIKRNIVHQAYIKALIAKDRAWVAFQVIESDLRVAERQFRRAEIAENMATINKKNAE